jgi:hypothetical protein
VLHRPALDHPPLSLVKEATTIGRLCKIGGEVVNTIMLGHSNKAHDGFLGTATSASG